ncbi:MAG: UvrD-helicase domain-containing protein [Planctomycetota bacterium]
MSIAEERIFSDLNPPQHEAVATLQGPLLILAGAGSGKTRVVTRRIANLIAHGARPWEILAITFTNKAAGEMRHRVESLLSDISGAGGDAGGTSGVWLSTFHSFCARVLRREASVLGLTRDFTIYDEDDATALLKEILGRLNLGEDKRYSARNLRQEISRLKNKAVRASDLPAASFHDRVLGQVFEEYEAGLKKNQAFDFDDLLRQAVLLFKDHPDVLDRYRNRFRYVLVDEYQDTNNCQYQLIGLLGAKHRNVCATGDPDQSIYAWRGADVRNILTFERDFPEAKTIKLEQNYRSTQRILKAASAVIAHNVERKEKTLWTQNPAGELLTCTVAGDEQLEAYEAARQIEQQVRAGRRYNEIAVFYRTNAQSRALEDALTKTNIPHVIVGGITFYERREVKDLLAYLRLIVNPNDDVSFRRVINVPKRGLGDTAVEALYVHAVKGGRSMMQALEGAEGQAVIASFKPKPRQGLKDFMRLYEALRALPLFPVAKLVKSALEMSGLRESLLAAGEQERVEHVDELVNSAAAFDDEMSGVLAAAAAAPPPEPGANDGLEELTQRQASLAGFLEQVALMAPTDDYDPEKEYVTLMTLHMAKGLEFPVVFITGLEEGLLPLLRSSASAFDGTPQGEDRKALEEERRLVYVGMTRAKEKLYLSRATYRRRYGKSEITVPSRFLDELPERLLEVQDRTRSMPLPRAAAPYWGGRGKEEEDETFKAFEREVGEVLGAEKQTRPQRSAARRGETATEEAPDNFPDAGESQEEAPELEIGELVRHPKFGIGTIEELSGGGLSRKAKVLFRKHGPKLLLLNLARLEKV